MYGSEEQHVTSTPLGLGAAPSFDRMTPPSSHLSPVSHAATQISKLSIPLHGSSLGAGGVTPYNINSVANMGFPLTTINGLTTASTSITTNNGHVTSSGILPNTGQMPSGSNNRNSMSPRDYQSSLEKARLNGIIPEIVRGGEIPHNPENKNGSRPHNNTTNTVVLGEAGGFKTMMWTGDKPREVLNKSVSPRAPPMSSDLRAGVDGMLSLCRVSPVVSPPSVQRGSPFGSGNPTSPTNIFKTTNSPPGNKSKHHSSSPTHDSMREQLNDSLYKKLTPSSTRPMPINMERLWQGDRSQLPGFETDIVANNAVNKYEQMASDPPPPPPNDTTLYSSIEPDTEPPLICMICDDVATGLHYGIITCEG